MDREYPVSLLLEGPLFRDELETQPQHFGRTHDIDSLRLVPSKSAANGVYTIYFSPEHRQWALVRLANRYRGLFEIQLQRGMSGEHQLLRQGFTSDDIDFLLDIVPRPPRDCSPVVYDMLWLVATYDEYLALAESILDRETFVPRELLRSTDGVSVDDEGFFTRFHRSHFIRPRESADEDIRRRTDGRRTEIAVAPDEVYEVTEDGSEALADLLAEYERIFKRKEFEPLLTNPELDPLRHLRADDPDSAEPTADAAVEDPNEGDGVLGEIAESFAPPADPDAAPADSADEGVAAIGSTDDASPPTGSAAGRPPNRDGSEPVRPASRRESPGATAEEPERGPPVSTGAADGGRSDRNRTESAEMVGEFTDAEVVDAAVAAATLIDDGSLVRTSAVKTTVWEAVDVDEREQGALWTAVRDVLLAMDGIHGREGGHVWTSSRSG